MNVNTAHCLFEQSGTFKNEFKKLGINAIDYDILNDFNETDVQIDLFEEIRKAYGGGTSIFDAMSSEDLLFAFFPCVRFEEQMLTCIRGDNTGMMKWNDEQKLKYSMKFHEEIHEMYILISMLALICIQKKLRLIIENPYATQHYLIRHWCLKPSLIDKDRSQRGDFYKKSTMYYFVGCKPTNNLIIEAQHIHPLKKVVDERGANRSMISKEYANRFIREFILNEEFKDVQINEQVNLFEYEKGN